MIVLDERSIDEQAIKENAIPIKYKNNYAVIQANELVRSKQDELSLLEAKLVRLAIAQVLKDDTDLETYTCNAAKLASFLGISRQAIYDDTLNLAQSLMKKTIFIREKTEKETKKKNYEILHWVDYANYKDGVITIKLSQHLKPYLIGLDELFSSYSYEEIINLNSTYAIRLYELLVSFANIQYREAPKFTIPNIPIERDEVIFTIEYLREYFNCEAKYSNNADFIKRVIETPIKDINKNTLFPCNFRVIKEGKKFAYVVFKLGTWNTLEGQMILDNFRQKIGDNNGK